jgi:predicted aminopeptidase
MSGLASRILAAASLALLLGACSTVGYYAHVVRGESALLSARRPVADILADPAADAKLKARLQLAQEARAFASERLGLPRNRSYSTYADLHRPYATWNVFAAPEFSLKPYERCYPVAGCVPYRGYYDLPQAQDYAKRLRARGLETSISGVSAFSTLGVFADPILNTMLPWSDDRLVGTIFHELAHQRLYVKDDSRFNESFATFVQAEGLRQWRASRGLPQEDDTAQQRADEFDQAVLAARGRLEALYASGLPADSMRARKREEIARLRAELVRLRDTRWGGDRTYDGWIEGEINNAKLLPFGIYHGWDKAFAALFRKSGGDWEAFYAAAGAIARDDAAGRVRRLRELETDQGD